MTLWELKKRAEQFVLSLQDSSMKVVWGFDIFTLKINYLRVDFDGEEYCFTIQKKKKIFLISARLRSRANALATFDRTDATAEDQACHYFDKLINNYCSVHFGNDAITFNYDG